MAPPRLAILSHVLPPAPSGQAVVLGRLLEALPRHQVLLLSRNPQATGADRLLAPARGGLLAGLWQEARELARVLRQERIEVLLAASGDLTDLPAAAMAARWTGVRLVPYMFDDYRYQWVGRRRWFATGAEPMVLRAAARVIVPNDYLGEEYRRRTRTPLVQLPNPCRLPDLAPLDAAGSPFAGGARHLVYTGSIYHAHFDAFRNLLLALARLARPAVRLHLFTSQTAAELAAAGLEGPWIELHAHLPPDEVPRYQRHADALFLPLAFHSPIPEVIRTSAPGKTGEYLAAGRPVLVHAPADAWMCGYFGRHGCGEVIGTLDPERLAAALARVLDDPAHAAELGARARARAEADFALPRVQQAFLALLQELRA